MFTDALELELKLKHEGTLVSIVGGNIKAWDLDLHNWGFRARVLFLISLEKEEDPLFALFSSPDLLTVELRIQPHLLPKGVTAKPLTIKGLVTKKTLVAEQTNDHAPQKKHPLLHRLYELEFADAAQVLWRCHRPFDLMVDKTVKDLLQAHKNTKVDLLYDWNILEQSWPVLCLSLGMEGNGANFYDFVLWYVRQHNGTFSYDPAANSYTLSAEKKDTGEAQALNRQWVESVHIDFPEPPRHAVRGLNAYSDNPQQQQINNPNAVEGVFCDYLGRYFVAADFDQRQQLESARLFTRGHELMVVFSQYPLIACATFSLIKLVGDLWGNYLFTKNKEYRVRSLHVRAKAVEQDITSDCNQPFNRFQMDMRSRLEMRKEKWTELPAFTAPRYPVLVEGKILSEQGEDQAQTYQLYEESKTSRNQYKVTIPLWNNQVVVTPFDPLLHSGHFYFPAYKRARVLVALNFHEAQIVQWLDWHDEAQLPADTQGNRILMGWTPSNRTTISHAYVNNLPVFIVERLADKDTESITMSDGTLVLQTMEKKK